MSARLETAAEVLKLERLLGLGIGDLDFLDDIPASELRALREKVTDSLFDAGAQMLGRLGAAAKLIPSPLVATIAERSFGPLLCARAAGSVDPGKAIDVAKRLSPGFLADATIELDPRRVARIIAGVPTSLVQPVAAELGRREEHVTMGRFLAFVPDNAIAAAMGALSDEAMLRTAFVLEHKDALDHAVGLLPPERLPGVLRCASENDLWPEALDLLDHLSHERRGPIADVVATLDEDLVQRLVTAVSEAGLWEALLPVVGTMSTHGRLTIASRAAFHEPRVLEEIVAAAAHDGSQWSHLLPLIDALPDEVSARAADLVAAQDEEVVTGLIDSVGELDLWASLLPVVRTMSEQSRIRMARMTCFHDVAVIRDVVTASADGGLWVDLVPLLRALPAEVVAMLPVVVTELDLATLERMLGQAVEAAESLVPMLDIVGDMDEVGRARVIEVIDGADRTLGELLVTALTDPDQVRLLLDHVPSDVLDAVERAADRLDLRTEFDAAIEGAKAL
jgi:hypothetical protein